MILTIGIEPDLKLVERLTFLQEDLGKILGHRGADSRWVRPEHVNLPLLYIGQQEEGALPEITKVMSEVSGDVSPFELSISGIAAYPSSECPRLIEAGVADGSKKVLDLHEKLQVAFARANFPSDRRVYHPSILLGRTVTDRDRVDLTDAIEAIGGLNFGKSEIFEMVLFASDLLESRTVHRVLSRCAFGKGMH